MQQRWTLLTLLVVLFLPVACRSAIISKKELRKLNDIYHGKVFVVKQDIHPAFLGSDSNDPAPVFRKGGKIGIWIESSNDWIRVKGYSLKESREQAAGKIIIYLFESNLKDKKKINQILQNRIDTFLENAGS